MHKEMETIAFVCGQGVQEVIASAQITKPTFVCAKPICQRVPPFQVEFSSRDCGAEQPHAASAVGDRESSPICLTRQHGGAGWQRRFARAGIRQKDNLLGLKPTRQPGVELPDRLGGEVYELHFNATLYRLTAAVTGRRRLTFHYKSA
jgi:hypothetical protein